jgi:hypothetical protein
MLMALPRAAIMPSWSPTSSCGYLLNRIGSGLNQSDCTRKSQGAFDP